MLGQHDLSAQLLPEEEHRTHSHAPDWLTRRIQASMPSLARFVDGTVLYILSREWHDIFSIQLLRLHPLPFCDEDASHLPCTQEAPSIVQAKFALSVLVVASVLQPVATHFERVHPELANIQPMLSMVIGWAAGFAAVAKLREWDELPGPVHSGSVNLVVCAGSTCVAAALILVCQPATLRAEWARWLSPRLDALWRFLSAGLSFAVMMLWNACISDALLDSVAQQERQGAVYIRMLFFFAISLTAACSLASVRLVRWRRRLHAMLSDPGGEEKEEAAFSSHSPRHSGTHGGMHGGTHGATHGLLITPPPVRRRLNTRAVLLHVLGLMEQTFGYVTGCAWTNCVVAITSLDALPTLAVTLADCLAAVALTLFAALWLLAVAAPAEQRVDRDADEREHVEIFYLTNAMCYFVGWAWVSCLRALATLVARLGNWIAMFGGPRAGELPPLPLPQDQGSYSGDEGSYAGELLCAFVFGPCLTMLLIRGHFLCATSRGMGRAMTPPPR